MRQHRLPLLTISSSCWKTKCITMSTLQILQLNESDQLLVLACHQSADFLLHAWSPAYPKRY